MTHRRRAIGAALAAAIAVAVPITLGQAASQAAAYRYWSYWLGSDSGWAFANVGPAFRLPADGTLEGWRFSVSGVDGNHAPSISADFDSVCGDTPEVEGSKRVAVVVDPGLPAHAPDGEQPPGPWAMCVTAEPRATGYDVLRAAATVRTDRGLICAVGGYPARGCADVVAAPPPTPSPAPSQTTSPESSSQPTPTSTPTPVPTSATPAVKPTAAPPSPAPTPSSTPSPDVSTASAAAPDPVASQTPTRRAASGESSLPPAAQPEPTYSLLTSPVDTPTSGGGSGGALMAGIAIAGIAGLGGAAILRMRRAG